MGFFCIYLWSISSDYPFHRNSEPVILERCHGFINSQKFPSVTKEDLSSLHYFKVSFTKDSRSKTWSSVFWNLILVLIFKFQIIIPVFRINMSLLWLQKRKNVLRATWLTPYWIALGTRSSILNLLSQYRSIFRNVIPVW